MADVDGEVIVRDERTADECVRPSSPFADMVTVMFCCESRVKR